MILVLKNRNQRKNRRRGATHGSQTAGDARKGNAGGFEEEKITMGFRGDKERRMIVITKFSRRSVKKILKILSYQ